jgi:uncharacterized membrane protein
MLTKVSQNDKLTQRLICIVAFYFFLSKKKEWQRLSLYEWTKNDNVMLVVLLISCVNILKGCLRSWW